MSEVHPTQVSDIDSNVSNDCDLDRNIENEKADVKNKSKTSNEEAGSATKKDDSGRKQNGSEVNKNDKTSEPLVNYDVIIGRHDDRNGVPGNATNTSDKLENNGEKKTPTQKGEKPTKKKKMQKENANGNVKEDGEKKKKKKKKKKKGGGCDDELVKTVKDGETSSSTAKDRSDNKNNGDKITSSGNESARKTTKPEPGDKIINETGNNKESLTAPTEETITNGENSDNKSCDLCFENGTQPNNNKDKESQEILDLKIEEKDTITPDLSETATETEQKTTPETNEKHNEPANSSNHQILDKETPSDNAENSQNITEVQQSNQIIQEDNLPTKNSSDKTITKDIEDASETANFLDTIIESDEISVTNDEDKTNENDMKESDIKNVDETVDKTNEQATDVKEDGDKFDDNADKNNSKDVDKDNTGGDVDINVGVREVDASIMDNDLLVDDARSSVLHMTNEQLQQRLQEQHEAMTRLQDYAHAQQLKSNLLATSLRAKLRRKDQELRLIQADHEQQVAAVITHLLYLEGQMQKEQNEIYEVLDEKNDVIRRQKAAIEDLVAKNNGYLQALKESHGFAPDNGLVKRQNHILEQNENISIQDHHNKVILRGHKNKTGEKPQTSSHKVRFSAMKDRLRRHKSSLELYQHQPLETLKETSVKYGSEENLVHRSAKPGVTDRKERCRSLIDYPVSLFDVEEGATESPDSCFGDGFSAPTIPRHDSTSSLVTLNDKSTRSNGGFPPGSVYGFNELSKSRSVPHGLPTVAENDASPTSVKGRPHSLPSVEMLAKEIAATTITTTATPVPSSKANPPTSLTTTSSSPPSESNPFKTFKNVFKRKGSKKKRAAAVTSGKEQTDVLKQHFKKYDMT